MHRIRQLKVLSLTNYKGTVSPSRSATAFSSPSSSVSFTDAHRLRDIRTDYCNRGPEAPRLCLDGHVKAQRNTCDWHLARSLALCDSTGKRQDSCSQKRNSCIRAVWNTTTKIESIHTISIWRICGFAIPSLLLMRCMVGLEV